MNLKTYVDLLDQIEKGIHPTLKHSELPDSKYSVDEHEKANIMLAELKSEALIDSDGEVHQSGSKLRITPKGALALFEWQEKLKEHSLLNKLKNSSVHLMWLFVGAVLSYVVRVFS
ncbi:hypothetical protein BCU61_012410 [Vibrio splendidus]|uniref:hypothetical protein n=1 Tax=Vibrio splendidus TaxID=29497 RepID=UPI000C831BD5|nr:hypothetical protein [Vibrio splendidus]PMH67078.1 hypothetical protein BCU61_21680 [Vibrio splendidus]PMJ32132.1 hypothetical protein BCU26_10730 [Vibrio splendidus]